MADKSEVAAGRIHPLKGEQREPASFLRQIFALRSWRMQPGRALDLATGRGRNALFLAQRGFAVEAIDISEAALADARKRANAERLKIEFRQADLEGIVLPAASCDLILNFNYLQRSLVAQMKEALRVGGRIIFETYLIDQQQIGHPKNPDYLLRHGELLGLFSDFRVFYYREGKFSEAGKEAFRAGLFGQKVR
jgi:tellurite methyltransferase